jgi:hypothetical protein
VTGLTLLYGKLILIGVTLVSCHHSSQSEDYLKSNKMAAG